MSRKPARPFAFQMPDRSNLSPRKTARQERAKATVEAIHIATFQVLKDVGYDRLTTTMVSERAGVSVGTLYQYYADKQSLIRAHVVNYVETIQGVLLKELSRPTDLRITLRHFVRTFVQFKVENRLQSVALRTVLVLADAQDAIDGVTGTVVAALEARIATAHPRLGPDRANQMATMIAAIVLGTTTETLERTPKAAQTPWFVASLQAAVLAVLPPERK